MNVSSLNMKGHCMRLIFYFFGNFTYLSPSGLNCIFSSNVCKASQVSLDGYYKLKLLLILLSLFLFTGIYLGVPYLLMMDWFGNLLDKALAKRRNWKILTLSFSVLCLHRQKSPHQNNMQIKSKQ